MQSPPTSPSCIATVQTLTSPVFDLGGASHVVGGVFRGWALGNVFNHADADEVIQHGLGPQVGRVQVYNHMPILPSQSRTWCSSMKSHQSSHQF